MRAPLLDVLAAYRDKGVVPENHAIARRNPVFIDGGGQRVFLRNGVEPNVVAHASCRTRALRSRPRGLPHATATPPPPFFKRSSSA